MRSLGAMSSAFALLFLGGCFSAHLMDSQHKAPLESQREFVDEFDNPATLDSRWRAVSGWWDIQKSHLIQKKPWKSPLPGSFQMIHVSSLADGAYEVETKLSFIKEGERSAGILLRFQDSNDFFMLRMRRYPNWQDNIDLVRYIDGERREDLRRMDVTLRPGSWYTLRAEDRGDEIVAFLDGAELFRYPVEDPPVGTVGLATRGGKILFERFTAAPHGSAPADKPNGEPSEAPVAAAQAPGPLADAL